MLQKVVLQIAAGIGGLWLATAFIVGVSFDGTLPLNILTLGLFSLVVNMLMVLAVDILFIDLTIAGLIPLFWTTLLVWGLSIIPNIFSK